LLVGRNDSAFCPIELHDDDTYEARRVGLVSRIAGGGREYINGWV